ncbi:MAG TPA: ATP-binding protein [Nitrospiraceae bacterium]|nr:ATP-binding protein [Nitrospiraceae bacterium]
MAQPMTDGHNFEILHDAFRSFDQAAGSLQEAYRMLMSRVERLDLELAASNEALRVNLKDNEEIKAHLTAILESLTTGVIVAGVGGVIIRCNQAAESLLGVSRDQMLGHLLKQFLDEKHLTTGCYPIVSPTGALLAILRTVLRDATGCPAGDLILLQDISDVRRLEERVQRRDRLAAMGEMVGRIAHEIRNPLGSVELFASMLRKDLAHDPTRRQYAEHISVAVQAMDRLLANLLTYTKPDCSQAGRHALRPLLEEVLMLAAHEIAKRHIDATLHIAASAHSIWCDAGQLKQALLNVCVNAAQAMPTGGMLRIDVSREVRCQPAMNEPAPIRISVSDTGPGIDPTHVSRVFDPFFTTRDEGTGLGLAIVHAIVEAHHGRVEIETQVGRGSTFTIVLPAEEAVEPSSAVPSLVASANGASEEES